MKKFLFTLLMLVVMVTVVSAYVAYDYMAPNALTIPTTLIIRKGTTSPATAQLLQGSGVVRHPYIFLAINYVLGASRNFKAGEYQFQPGITPFEVAQKLRKGEVVIHKITLPEGWNVRQITELLIADTVLEGEITLPIPEGSLLPETYYYTAGDTRNTIIKRMQTMMQEVLADSWNKRKEGLPFKTPQEAMVLASIVEKETGVATERPLVASVFINRLRIGMPLQTDPTVMYGIEQATGVAMERPLSRKDLETPSAYNTYMISGLPPTPIANPGIDAIQAVLIDPADTDALYFVASGEGGHRFAKTLEEHNRNVAAYRALHNGK